MAKDARWPALPLVLLRGVQLFFGILALGLSGYLVAANRTLGGFGFGSFLGGAYGSRGSSGGSSGGSGYDYGDSDYGNSGSGDNSDWFSGGTPPRWGYAMTLTAAIFTIFYAITNFVLLSKNRLLPVAIVVVDSLITVFWITALGGLGATKYLSQSCSPFGSLFGLGISCQLVKAAFGISFLIFLTFIGTLIIASIALHRNRGDIRGTNYNSGLDPEGNPLPQASAVITVDNVQGAAASAYYQEPKQNYAPTPQVAATPVYYDHQHTVASPPAATGPYIPPQGVPPQGMPQPPPNSVLVAGH